MQYIGGELQERMNLLGISVSNLSDKAFMSEDMIQDIIENKIAYEEMDEFDLSLLSSALHCDSDYFISEEIRKKDLLVLTMNRGNDTIKSRNIKAKIQDFVKDYAFVNEILEENDMKIH